jgi:SAM-dependent methyltransferase
VLTVDYRRLGLAAGERLLDLGCGYGRHAFAAARAGAAVVALDAGTQEVEGVRGMLCAMVAQGELDPARAHAGVVQGDALSLPFADGAFDRVIASEVLEHIADDSAAIAELARVLRPGGTMAVTVPRCGPEVVNWLLSDAYHDVPGGHIRIYRRSTLWRRLEGAGLVPVASHHAHGLHAPYWWLRCLVGPSNDTHPAVAAYHRLLVWDIMKAPRLTRLADRLLNPLIGKSLVVYVRKPAEAAHGGGLLASTPDAPTATGEPAATAEPATAQPATAEPATAEPATLDGAPTRGQAAA